MRLKLVHPHSILIQPPFLGHAAGGIEIPFNDGLPKIYARVVGVHPTVTTVRPGDIITFKSNSYEEYYLQSGKRLYAMDERAVLAVIKDWVI